jgi:Tol biopolymer transport system component
VRRAVAAAVLLALAGAGAAQAFYPDGASIVSAHFGRLEQADDASQFAAVAGDGRYVVFQTRARNLYADDDPDPPGRYRVGGIFRMELATRSIELVADGELRDEASDAPVTRGAQNPSVSADGRYVAFSTAHRLVAADTNGNVDVYVRDMAVPIRAAGAFELVSAKDGGNEPAAYAPRDPDLPGFNPGAEVTPGAAISSDGSKVVFRTIQVDSDLPDRPGTDTPGFQVLLRDRSADTTTLVTRATSDGAPAGGALGPAGLSADGTTILWTGRNAPAQTRFINGESTDPAFFHYLWRRIADGPAAPTRRITGVSDPDDPACPPNVTVVFDQTSTGPCYGPLTEPEYLRANISNLLPAMSGDGRVVAFLTGTGPRPNANTQPGLDLFLTDMSPGVTRKAGTVELTRDAAANDPKSSSPIESVTMSADGSRLLVTSSRTDFVLPALRFTGSGRLAADVRELYSIDLRARTIERVTRAYNGADIDGDVLNDPTLSADGSRIGFASFAGNLFFGDGFSHPDAFWTELRPEPQPGSAGGGGASGSGQGTVIVEEDPDGPDLGARVVSGRRGRIKLRLRVPGPGTATAAARARVGRPRARRTLARVTRFSPRAGTITVELRIVRRYRRELQRRGRIRVRIAVTFSPSRGGARLTRSVGGVFRK